MKKQLLVLLLTVVALPALVLLWLWPRYDYLPAQDLPFYVERIGQDPLIHAGLSERLSEVSGGRERYANINGPSLIRVPDWLPNPLGRYYLYFAHHKGDHIRLAYADTVEGPWKIYEPGALSLEDSGFPTDLSGAQPAERGLQELWDNYSIYVVRDMLQMGYRSTVTDPATRKERGVVAAANSRPHIASPEVVIDSENQRLVMYYHGLAGKTAQYTRIAASKDGLSFDTLPGTLQSNYLRTFVHNGQWYGLAMPGILYRSETGIDDFEPRRKLLFEPLMRHAGLWLRGDTLYVLWSRVGDAPERIMVSEIDLTSPDWDDWRATEPVELLRPELPWEGSELKVEASLRGELGLAVNELRDPFVFVDGETTYLLYTGSGEQAIGLGRLVERSPRQ